MSTRNLVLRTSLSEFISVNLRLKLYFEKSHRKCQRNFWRA